VRPGLITRSPHPRHHRVHASGDHEAEQERTHGLRHSLPVEREERHANSDVPAAEDWDHPKTNIVEGVFSASGIHEVKSEDAGGGERGEESVEPQRHAGEVPDDGDGESPGVRGHSGLVVVLSEREIAIVKETR